MIRSNFLQQLFYVCLFQMEVLWVALRSSEVVALHLNHDATHSNLMQQRRRQTAPAALSLPSLTSLLLSFFLENGYSLFLCVESKKKSEKEAQNRKRKVS